jgi:flagellum-specific peptidoglycan hydrolase FlgJ
MTPKDFVEKYYQDALTVQNETGIPAIAIMAQAALESGWGAKAIGNNLFGIKYRKGDPGYRKFLTTEHSKDRSAYNGQDVKSVNFNKRLGVYVFKVWQYFTEYPSAEAAFKAHTRLLLTDRYIGALKWKHSPIRYLIAIWRAGYATDKEYDVKMEKMVDSVEKRLPKLREVIKAMTKIKGIEAKMPGSKLNTDLEVDKLKAKIL